MALIACACLVAQVSALAHRVLVQHVTCVEHGESAHAHIRGTGSPGEMGVADGAASSFAFTSFDGWRARLTSVPALTADEHDHCSVVAFRHSRPDENPDWIPAPGLCSDQVGDLREFVAGPVVATYLVAPKTSPPRRA